VKFVPPAVDPYSYYDPYAVKPTAPMRTVIGGANAAVTLTDCVFDSLVTSVGVSGGTNLVRIAHAMNGNSSVAVVVHGRVHVHVDVTLILSCANEFAKAIVCLVFLLVRDVLCP
jgi:hypothetical protein